jgi:hypothetical protein
MKCRYLDTDNKVVGEALIELGIRKFREMKRINKLEDFPLEFHPNESEMKAHLVECGRRFLSLIDAHHRWYRGKAFYTCKGRPMEVFVNSRIIIDALYSREVNPNYARSCITEPDKNRCRRLNSYGSADTPKNQADQQ